MAIDWGVLLNAAGQGLSNYRQGQREQKEQNRQYEMEDANRLFNEWAKRRQMELDRTRLNQQNELGMLRADIQQQGVQQREEASRRTAETQKYLREQIEKGLASRFQNAGGATVQDASGRFNVLPRNQIGPTKVVAPLPESRDGVLPAAKQGGGGHLSQYQALRVAGELSDLADIISKARSSAETFGDKSLGNTTGWLRGRLNPVLEAAGRVPQKQVSAVANMENVGSAIRLARAGTAVSKFELQNLGFIPTKNMPEEGVRTRLQELADNAERLLQTKLDMYEAAGLDLSAIRAKLNAQSPKNPFRNP